MNMSDDRQNVVDMAGTRVDDDHLLSMYIDNELDAERTISLVTRLRSTRHFEPDLPRWKPTMRRSERYSRQRPLSLIT